MALYRQTQLIVEDMGYHKNMPNDTLWTIENKVSVDTVMHSC